MHRVKLCMPCACSMHQACVPTHRLPIALFHLFTQYSYGLDLFLLSIDEGIAGYRDDSLDTVGVMRAP